MIYEFIFDRIKASSSLSPIMGVEFANPSYPEKIFKTIALIDTGADFCILPKSASKLIGIDLEDSGAETVKLSCACGNEVYHGHKFKINIAIKNAQNEEKKFLLWVIFSSTDKVNTLLGMNFMRFFDKIEISIKENKGKLINFNEEFEEDG